MPRKNWTFWLKAHSCQFWQGKGRMPAGSSLQSSCFAGLSTEKSSWKAKSKDKWGMRSISTEFFLTHAKDVDLLGPMLCNSSSWKGVLVKLHKLLCCSDFFLLFSLGQEGGRFSVMAAGEREETELTCRKEFFVLYQSSRRDLHGEVVGEWKDPCPHLSCWHQGTKPWICSVWSLAT